ncbi:predicted protein [Nematostella vectensis]|uniref:Uncharacterized protein n=1 Tax=Nematostella vectensis TaxID=45351 RepID=A7T5C4_NEMVE|nr:predicted protein [Nematostella vectensis]|eukprot:XP_001620938.1 hypothetical protein NEMVEDRAFT_v1g222535 [Nematostella vectensis]
MAEELHYYSVKAGLHIGVVDVLCGLISIGIGAFNTRNDEHTVITKFQAEGLPIWTGILFVITGGVGILTYKNPRKCIVVLFMLLSVLSTASTILVFWEILPLLLSGKKDVPWNLSYGSFLGLCAIVFVISMKGIYISFKATFMYSSCRKRQPPRESQNHATLCSEFSLYQTASPFTLKNGVSHLWVLHHHLGVIVNTDHTAHLTGPGGIQGERQHCRELSPLQPTPLTQPRPPPPPYRTLKFPHLPAYSEIEATPPPPPYTEK